MIFAAAALLVVASVLTHLVALRGLAWLARHDRLTARSHIHDIYEKTGRSGQMVFIVHRMEFSNQREELVSIVDWRFVQRPDQ